MATVCSKCISSKCILCSGRFLRLQRLEALAEVVEFYATISYITACTTAMPFIYIEVWYNWGMRLQAPVYICMTLAAPLKY